MTSATSADWPQPSHQTHILPVNTTKLGTISINPNPDDLLDDWGIGLNEDSEDFKNLQNAASKLRISDIPVAFPTETVYGLAADATRSSAVRGIFEAKRRPADNPLIVHVASLTQLRDLLRPNSTSSFHNPSRRHDALQNGTRTEDDPIPSIYRPLIRRFWPGPLTIILPNPPDSQLAKETTAGLSTFGARMPANLLALLLIRLSGLPLAAPSANASTKPSPTAAEHVLHDLRGRIDIILDGGPCDVGVESTVVDGLSDPPAILRPGGVSLEEIRGCEGWENVVAGWKDGKGKEEDKPRAPGMKYRHYAPQATVVLYEVGASMPTLEDAVARCTTSARLGIVRTRKWPLNLGMRATSASAVDGEQRQVNGANPTTSICAQTTNGCPVSSQETKAASPGFRNLLHAISPKPLPTPQHSSTLCEDVGKGLDIWDVCLGNSTEAIARGLFGALRELDRRDVDAIFVEGIDDSEGEGEERDIGRAGAIMNRLRKAAAVRLA